MIDYLKETFEHLPKQAGETERKLAVHENESKFSLKLTLYINGVKVWATFRVENSEADDETIVRHLCWRLKDEIDRIVGDRDASNSTHKHR